MAKPKVTEEDRLWVTSKVTEPNHRLKLVNRLRSSVFVDCTEKKDAWFVTLRVKRMRLRFKIDTGADVTIITKKTWLAMKDVSLNSVGGQLNAFGQFMAVTKHRNTVYRFNVIVIDGEKMTNLLSRDIAADMGLVCRLEQDRTIGLVRCDDSGHQENRSCAYLRRLDATEYSSST